MDSFLLYIIKSGLCLALFYVGYKFLLSKDTFFHFNRKILLTGILACMLLPFVKIMTETAGVIQQSMMQLEKIITEEDYSYIFTLVNDETVSTPTLNVDKRNLNVNLPALIFAVGFFINLFLLVRSHISLYLLIRSGRKIAMGHCTIVLLDKPIIPFNYGRYIILSEKDYENHPNVILSHEMAHYRLLHSLDIVMIEFLILLQWFNPFIRLLKKELCKIHEFQADAEVLKTGIDTTEYQLLLIKKAVGSGPYTFANNFNHNKLKIRFIMMSKKKSNSWARMKLLVLLPVVALNVYAFARPKGSQQLEQIIRSENTTNTISDTCLLSVVFMNNGVELRSFSLKHESESHAVFNEIKEWLKNQKCNQDYFTTNIKAASNTPMGLIIDLKEILRETKVMKISYTKK